VQCSKYLRHLFGRSVVADAVFGTGRWPMTGTGCRLQLELSLCARGMLLFLCFTSALDGGEWSATRPNRFSPPRKSPLYIFSTSQGWPQSRSVCFGRRKKLLAPTEIRTLNILLPSPVTVPTDLSQLTVVTIRTSCWAVKRNQPSAVLFLTVGSFVPALCESVCHLQQSLGKRLS
jgi:hypothetical protein